MNTDIDMHNKGIPAGWWWYLFLCIMVVVFIVLGLRAWNQETREYNAMRDGKIITVPSRGKQYYPDAVLPYVYFPVEGAEKNLQDYEAVDGQPIFYIALKLVCNHGDQFGGQSCKINQRMSASAQAELKKLCYAAEYPDCAELYP